MYFDNVIISYRVLVILMAQLNYYYKNLLGSVLYEETRKSLSRDEKPIPDQVIEDYYEKIRQNIEINCGYIFPDTFKDLCHFSNHFNLYYDTLTPEQLKSMESLDGIAARIYVIEMMHKDGCSIPQLILDEVEKSKMEKQVEKEFFTSLLSRHEDTPDGIRDMYQEYRFWCQCNFPEGKMMASCEFLETLQSYLPPK